MVTAYRPVSVSGMQWPRAVSQQSSYVSQKLRRPSPTQRHAALPQPPKTQPEVVAREPSDEEIACAFAAYDPDSTTYMPTANIGDLMADLGMPLNPHQLVQAKAQLDRNQCGQVSFGEFLLWWKG